MVKGQSITKAFAEVVTRANAKCIAEIQANDSLVNGAASLIEELHYEYGHLWEIIATLQTMTETTEDKFKRFPLVWLVEDIQQTTGTQGQYDIARCTVIIAMSTDYSYKSSQREHYTFEPILRPVYKALMQAMADSPFFDVSDAEYIPHTYIERKFWGRENLTDGSNNTANTLNDFVDAIELRNVELIINTNCYNPVNIN